MDIARSNASANTTRVIVLTPDAAFAESVRETFCASPEFALTVVPSSLSATASFDPAGADAIVIDIEAGCEPDMGALQALVARAGGRPPVIAVTQGFDARVARRLLQLRIADVLTKPVSPVELQRACQQVYQGSVISDQTDAQIYSYLPAVGGAGATTLAIQTAMLLLNSGPRHQSTTCLVDLDFQNGACADYLDLEPRLNLSEIEPRPERLDRQLLEVMLSHHASGLAVVAAPNRPAATRSLDPEIVMRLLDLVSTHFNYVVFDLPRTWFTWTDSVLLGSNRLFIVSEMTVPSLRHARQLADAIEEQVNQAPAPEVIVNRYEQRLFGTTLRRSDIEQALGAAFTGVVPNNYRLVREAIDRGVPLDDVKAGNKISLQLKKVINRSPGSAATKAKSNAPIRALNLVAAR